MGSICCSLFSLQLTSHTQPFRNKCERYIFLKKCVRSSLLLILFPHVYVYSCICITAMQQNVHILYYKQVIYEKEYKSSKSLIFSEQSHICALSFNAEVRQSILWTKITDTSLPLQSEEQWGGEMKETDLIYRIHTWSRSIQMTRPQIQGEVSSWCNG